MFFVAMIVKHYNKILSTNQIGKKILRIERLRSCKPFSIAHYFIKMIYNPNGFFQFCDITKRGDHPRIISPIWGFFK